MELIIKRLPTKRKNPTDKEREIIKRALISYQVVLGQYEKYTDDMKRKDLERLARENNKQGLDAMNPFNVDMTEGRTYEPTLEDTKIFVYSSWAEAIANVQTPYICNGAKRKGIRKHAFMDVQNGKFLINKVLEIMNNFIDRLSENKVVEDNSDNIND
jgi:hypothetical protein